MGRPTTTREVRGRGGVGRPVPVGAIVPLVIAAIMPLAALGHEEPSAAEARAGLMRAVDFFRTGAGCEGGYGFRVSADLVRREGERALLPRESWIEPPATPAVGQAFLDAFLLTGAEPLRDDRLLDAAVETGMLLVRGQLESGGWGQFIALDPEARRGIAYRVEGGAAAERQNTTTFDDDKTQSCVRFLVTLGRTLDRERPRAAETAAIRGAADHALEALAAAQQYDRELRPAWRGSSSRRP